MQPNYDFYSFYQSKDIFELQGLLNKGFAIICFKHSDMEIYSLSKFKLTPPREAYQLQSLTTRRYFNSFKEFSIFFDQQVLTWFDPRHKFSEYEDEALNIICQASEQLKSREHLKNNDFK